MTDAGLIRAVGATRMSHAGTGSVAAALDRIEAAIAHNTAQLQRIIAAFERIAGKPLPDGLTNAERNATRG